MGDVDLLDIQISLQDMKLKSGKWRLPIFTQMLDVDVVSTWRANHSTKGRRRSVTVGCTVKAVLVFTSKCTVFRGNELWGGRDSIELNFDLGAMLLYQSPQKGDVCSAVRRQRESADYHRRVQGAWGNWNFGFPCYKVSAHTC
jgi:hypothetical protein